MTVTRALALVLLVCCLPACGTKFMRPAGAGEIVDVPPEGKVIVNVHRPSGYAGGIWYPIFDGNVLMGANKGGQYFQYTCDSGEHVFIGRHSYVSVISAKLLPDKVYDLVVDTGLGLFSASVTLHPITNTDERRNAVGDWQASEHKMVLVRDGRVAEYETYWAEDNAQAVADFVNGDKRERLMTLAEGDHR